MRLRLASRHPSALCAPASTGPLRALRLLTFLKRSSLWRAEHPYTELANFCSFQDAYLFNNTLGLGWDSRNPTVDKPKPSSVYPESNDRFNCSGELLRFHGIPNSKFCKVPWLRDFDTGLTAR